MTSDALIAMIERKLKAYGLKKVVPDDKLLGEAYRTFHRSNELARSVRGTGEQIQGEQDQGPEELEGARAGEAQKAPRSALGRCA